MLFNSYSFIFIFLPITLLLYYFVNFSGYKKHQYKLLILLIASFFFYGYWNPKYLILISISILFNFFIGKEINNNKNYKLKKIILFLGVTFNLLLLIYFKYSNFFIENLENVFKFSISWKEVILPIAISFFTFQQIAYLVDVYNNKTKEHKILNYALFVSFFPQLIAGPIVYHKEMRKQLIDKKIADKIFNNLSLGISIFALGLFKKVIIADSLESFASPLFESVELGNTLTLIEAWGAMFAFTFQIYFDFSGYSDMAIGLARLFGFKLPYNFNSPYLATNVVDFWKRWHITLSRFIRNYLYIKLKEKLSNFSKKTRMGNISHFLFSFFPLIIAFTLSGLWHGAAWNFFLWGCLHSFYIIINRIWKILQKELGINQIKNNLYKIFCIFITFISVSFAFVLFRSTTLEVALSIYESLLPEKTILLPSELIGKWEYFLTPYLKLIPLFNFKFEGNFVINVKDFVEGGIFIIISFFIVWFFKNSNSFVKIENNKLIFPQLIKYKMNSLGVFIVYFMFLYSLILMINTKIIPYVYFQF